MAHEVFSYVPALSLDFSALVAVGLAFAAWTVFRGL
jgi:hypothetical protein